MLVKNELKKEDQIKKLQTYYSSFFIGQSYFFNDKGQLYLIFQMLYYSLKRLDDTEEVISLKSKGYLTEKHATHNI